MIGTILRENLSLVKLNLDDFVNVSNKLRGQKKKLDRIKHKHQTEFLKRMAHLMAKTMKNKINKRLSSGIHHKGLPFISSKKGFPPNKQFGFLSKAIITKKVYKNLYQVLINPQARTKKGVIRRGIKSRGGQKVSEYAEILENRKDRPFFYSSIEEFLRSSESDKLILKLFADYEEEIEKLFSVQ